jgi:hypothetical protein
MTRYFVACTGSTLLNPRAPPLCIGRCVGHNKWLLDVWPVSVTEGMFYTTLHLEQAFTDGTFHDSLFDVMNLPEAAPALRILAHLA